MFILARSHSGCIIWASSGFKALTQANEQHRLLTSGRHLVLKGPVEPRRAVVANECLKNCKSFIYFLNQLWNAVNIITIVFKCFNIKKSFGLEKSQRLIKYVGNFFFFNVLSILSLNDLQDKLLCYKTNPTNCYWFFFIITIMFYNTLW